MVRLYLCLALFEKVKKKAEKMFQMSFPTDFVRPAEQYYFQWV